MLKKYILKLLLKLRYRVKVSGFENYQAAEGKVLYVLNPSSLLDPILLALFVHSDMTYIVDKEIADRSYIRPMRWLGKVIEVDFSSPNSTKEIINALDEHSHCVVFQDTQLFVDSKLMRIYESAALIASKAKATLLPVRIDGADYSSYSYFQHKANLKSFPKISISILKPQKIQEKEGLSNKEKRKFLASELHALMLELRYRSGDIEKSILQTFVEAIKIHGKNKVIAEDHEKNSITYKNIFLKGQALGGAMHKLFPNEKYIGFMLPNSLAAVVAFMGLHFYKHIPAMINFSAGTQPVIVGCQTVQVKTIISSRKFIQLAELKNLEDAILREGIRIVYLEDVSKSISLFTKLSAVYKTLFLKVPHVDHNEACAVLYTSGSEGMPKAVLMSHRNVMANHEQTLASVYVTSADKFFTCLPMFHTFGLTVGTLLPLLRGVPVFMYPSPLHYRIVPQLFYESRSTFLCGTDTFFSGYARYGKPFEFFNMRYMVAGAEKLREATANLYRDIYGVNIIEGYGVTETSPVVSVNTPANTRARSVGKLFPGLEYKLDPVEGIDVGGCLCLRGDSVMLGYMRHSNPGVLEPLFEGWHNTGDIVEVDNERYIFIKGRAKRFAKIGGEMVSLTAVEQALDGLINEVVYGVVSVPDDRKGEVLVLIIENHELATSQIATYFAQKGLTPLWTPKKIINVKQAPMLGSGKFDYQGARKLAIEALGV